MTERAKTAAAFAALFLTGCLHAKTPTFAETARLVNARANETALARLRATPESGSLAFALFSDSHEDYGDLRKVVRAINAEADLDFVVNLGDFTNDGRPEQYRRFLEAAEDLKPPTITVAGNHDVENGGLAMFAPIFGFARFSFDREGLRFIAFSPAGAGDPADFGPDGLARAVAASPIPVVILTHLPPGDAPANPLLLAAGHLHRYGLREDGGVTRLQVPRVRGRQWVRVDVEGAAGLRPKIRVSQRP